MEEPGLCGVVVAGDGRRWIRWSEVDPASRDWVRPDPDGRTEYLRWDQLEVLHILSRGVEKS